MPWKLDIQMKHISLRQPFHWVYASNQMGTGSKIIVASHVKYAMMQKIQGNLYLLGYNSILINWGCHRHDMVYSHDFVAGNFVVIGNLIGWNYSVIKTLKSRVSLFRKLKVHLRTLFCRLTAKSEMKVLFGGRSCGR